MLKESSDSSHFLYKIFSYLYILKTFVFIYLFMAVVGLCCCVRAFSSCGNQGLLSSCGARAAHCSGFHGAESRVQASAVVAQQLVALQHMDSSRSRGRTHAPCIGGQILNHWTSREVQISVYRFFVAPLNCKQHSVHYYYY